MVPKIIEGSCFDDSRGKIMFVNDFVMNNILRFYLIEHSDIKIIRAWQGHQKESKYFFPIKGSFLLAWVKIDNFTNPSVDLKANHTVLSSDQPRVLHIPPGYANGLRAHEKNSILGVFSDRTLEQSEIDDFRYPTTNWFDWEIDL